MTKEKRRLGLIISRIESENFLSKKEILNFLKKLKENFTLKPTKNTIIIATDSCFAEIYNRHIEKSYLKIIK